jgi:RND superfamily putative drug exporter
VRTRRAVLRAVALVLVLAGWLAVAGAGGPLVGRLSEVQTNDNASFLPDTAESTEVARLAAGFSDQLVLPFFVVVEKPGGLGPEDLTAVQQWAAGVPELPVAVDSHPAPALGRFLADGPVAVVPSEDGMAVFVPVPVSATAAAENLPDGESVLFGAAATLRASAAAHLEPQGLHAYVAGPGGVLADMVNAFAGIDGRLLQVTVVVVFIILLLVYRSPVLPVVALLTALVALSAAGLVVYPLAKSGTIELSGQSQGILFILVVGAATDYALLLISRYREELHDEASRLRAMRRAWRGAVEPIVASGSTVILGLLCLLLADLGSTRGLGPVGAIGIAASLLAVLTLLPVLLLAGRWLFWPRIPRVDHVHSWDGVVEVAAGVPGGRGHGVWPRVARLVERRTRLVWGATLVGLLALATFVPQFDANGLRQTEIFRDRVESVVGTEVIARHFPGGEGSPVLIIAPAGDLDRVLELTTSVDGVTAAVPTGVAATAPGGPPAPPRVVDGLVEVEATLQPAADSRAAENVVAELRSLLDEVSPDVLVGGQTAANLDLREASRHDLRLIVPTVLLVIFVVLMLLLRSVTAALLLVVANVLSFAATIGASAIVFGPRLLDLPGGDPSIPLYGFVFLVALGIDYSIFLMTRVREESGRRGTRPGVLVGLAVTGGVITSAGLVLAATFSALVTIPLVFMLQIAFIVAFGVLLDTFVVRSLLVPALAYDLGPRVWWPSRLARRG